MKEVDLFPDDPKSADCINQLHQVLLPISKFSDFTLFKKNKIGTPLLEKTIANSMSILTLVT
jgi:hypothetical protein